MQVGFTQSLKIAFCLVSSTFSFFGNHPGITQHITHSQNWNNTVKNGESIEVTRCLRRRFLFFAHSFFFSSPLPTIAGWLSCFPTDRQADTRIFKLLRSNWNARPGSRIDYHLTEWNQNISLFSAGRKQHQL